MIEEMITPPEIQELLHRAPMKLDLIDGSSYTKANNLRFVTSPNIFEPNSSRFHPDGLFSEEIFGSITSMDRFTTEAAIALNTNIIHPMLFASVIQPKNLYGSIMNSKQYAVFNEETYTFDIADEDDNNAGTGYQFFLTHIKYLANAPAPPALRASNLHKLLVKYKDRMITDHLVCLPAGLRDLDLKSPRLSKDDINKLYMAVINLATSLSDYALSEDTIFDGIRYQIQLRVAAVYTYLMNIISGKGGFMQKHYGARKIAYSTRNVISVPTIDADTSDDPSNIKADETMMPMLNLIKCFQPFFTNFVLKKLYGELFIHGASETVPATNMKTLGIEYITIKTADIKRYTTVDGIVTLINQFKYVGFRESPVSIQDVNRKEYALLLTYTTKDRVYIGKTGEDLKLMIAKDDVVYDAARVSPIRWAEVLYLAGLQIVDGKHALVTRYPVLGDGSIYPSKIHSITTNPSKVVEVVFDSGLVMKVPHYPIIGNPYYESLIVHPSRLPGLGADFDGDCVSITSLWTKEGNADITKNLSSVSSVIDSNMKLKIGASGDIVTLAIHNLSRQDL